MTAKLKSRSNAHTARAESGATISAGAEIPHPPETSAEIGVPAFGIAREAERLLITGVSRVQWWRSEREGKAPQRVSLGANSVGWVRSELHAWVAKRVAGRAMPNAPSKHKAAKLHLKRNHCHKPPAP